MPIKRRIEKRRLSPEAECAAWHDVFQSGFDFFGDAAELTGLREPIHFGDLEAREEAREPWLAAARDAWTRHGARWLAEHSEQPRLHAVWAVEQFGLPWERAA